MQQCYRHLFNNVTFVKKKKITLCSLCVTGSAAHDQRSQRPSTTHRYFQEERRSSDGGISFCNTRPSSTRWIAHFIVKRSRSLAKRDKTGLKLGRISTLVAHFLFLPSFLSFLNLERIHRTWSLSVTRQHITIRWRFIIRRTRGLEHEVTRSSGSCVSLTL